MTQLLPLGTALVLGVLHALEVDHMVAVTTFVSRRPALLTALGFGARWGVGHSAAVLVAGALLLATGLSVSGEAERALEGAVGVALVGVGLWSLRATRNLHLHPPAEHGDHAHLHRHREAAPGHRHPHDEHHPVTRPHRHGRGVTALGLLHGLAGTTAAVALIPVTMAGSVGAGLLYLAAFSVGVTAGMAAFALAAAVAIRQAAGRSVAWARKAAGVAAVASVGVGIWWLLRALGGA